MFPLQLYIIDWYTDLACNVAGDDWRRIVNSGAGNPGTGREKRRGFKNFLFRCASFVVFPSTILSIAL